MISNYLLRLTELEMFRCTSSNRFMDICESKLVYYSILRPYSRSFYDVGLDWKKFIFFVGFYSDQRMNGNLKYIFWNSIF